MSGGVLGRISADAVEEEGDVARFEYEDRLGREWEAVVMRRKGELVAFRNVCPHLGLPLDCQGGGFEDDEREDAFQCDAHGARFRVEDGRCVRGPCPGEYLEMLRAEPTEAGDEIVVRRGRSVSI